MAKPFNKPYPTSTSPTISERPILSPDGMSRAKQILPLLPFGKTTLYKWSADGRFPAPVRITPAMTAWRNRDVLQWLEQHAPEHHSEEA